MSNNTQQGTPRFIDNQALISAESRILDLKSSIAAVQKLADEFERLRKASEHAAALRDELASAERDFAQLRAESLAYNRHRIGEPVISYRPDPNTDSPLAAKIEVTFTNPDGERRSLGLRNISYESVEANVLYAHPDCWPVALLKLGNGDPKQAMQVYLRGLSRGHL